MKQIVISCATALLLASTIAMAAVSDDKAQYDRQAAARYGTLFQSLDRNGDGVVTRLEAQGDLNFSPRFDDMDTNRDDKVTVIELQQFVEREHGVQLQLNPPAAITAR